MAVVLEDARERVPVGGVPTAGRDQGAGGVGGDELNEHPAGDRRAAGAEAFAGVEHRAQRPPVPVV